MKHSDIDYPAILRTPEERNAMYRAAENDGIPDNWDNRPLVGPITIVGCIVLMVVVGMVIIAATVGRLG